MDSPIIPRQSKERSPTSKPSSSKPSSSKPSKPSKPSSSKPTSERFGTTLIVNHQKFRELLNNIIYDNTVSNKDFYTKLLNKYFKNEDIENIGQSLRQLTHSEARQAPRISIRIDPFITEVNNYMKNKTLTISEEALKEYINKLSPPQNGGKKTKVKKPSKRKNK
jgi:hypothetical protein